MSASMSMCVNGESRSDYLPANDFESAHLFQFFFCVIFFLYNREKQYQQLSPVFNIQQLAAQLVSKLMKRSTANLVQLFD